MEYTSAINYLREAATIMEDRAKEYDQPEGERSMEKIVKIFNIYADKDLKESDGWLFMQILKDVRQWSAKSYHLDSAKDCIAYAALKAESLEKESKSTSRKSLEELEQNISDLKDLLEGAAEEINLHWGCPCDEEGYGPRSLMNQLERYLKGK